MTRKYFGGLFTSTKTLNAGDRVRLRRIRGGDPTSGVIQSVTRDAFGCRMADVLWDAGIYVAYRQADVPVSSLRRDGGV